MDSVARLLPFLSGIGVESRDAVAAPGASVRVLILDDERTLFEAEGLVLSEVSGGVTSCRAAETERVDKGASMGLALVEALREASLAFCARVEMIGLKGTTVEDLLLARLSGDAELDNTEGERPLAIPRPRGWASGSGVGKPCPLRCGEEATE